MTAAEPMQPYAEAYMTITRNLSFTAWQFMIWMGEQWRTWGDEVGVDVGRHLTEADHVAFGAWLTERAEAMA